jgi:hypothetical protein
MMNAPIEEPAVDLDITDAAVFRGALFPGMNVMLIIWAEA